MNLDQNLTRYENGAAHRVKVDTPPLRGSCEESLGILRSGFLESVT